MERLTNHFDYCKMIDCKFFDAELFKQNKCKFFDLDISHCHEKRMNDKLREYEDAEEQGMLIRLPCKVGDTVYEICNDCRYSCTEEEEYEDCTECPHSKMNIHEQVFVTVGIIADNMDKFGKTVFLTREEAEAALERMGKE